MWYGLKGKNPLANDPVLFLTKHILDEMLHQAQSALPHECCGWLAGRKTQDSWHVTHHFPMRNIAEIPERQYLADSQDLFTAHKALRKENLDHLVIYHSHPTSPAIPSATDLAVNYWPDVFHLIITLQDGQNHLRVWSLQPDSYSEVKWKISENTDVAIPKMKPQS